MFRKLTNGLLSPKATCQYHNEKLIKTLLYLLILVILTLIPTVISTCTSSLINESYRKKIKLSFSNEDIPFTIANGVLENKNANDNYIYQNNNLSYINIYITENVKNVTSTLDTNINIVLAKENVYIVASTISYPLLKYSDYEYLSNLDLSDKSIINSVTFWDNIFSIINNEYSKVKPFVCAMVIISNFIHYLLVFIIYALLLSLFFGRLKYGNAIKFSSFFKISIYNLTPFVFCSLFANIFGMNLLFYVGYIISAIYTFTSFAGIVMDHYLDKANIKGKEE